MRKKSGLTIVEQAIVLVPGFEKVVRKLEQQVTLRGQSNSTLQNYIRRIALFVLHIDRIFRYSIIGLNNHMLILKCVKERPFNFILKSNQNRR